MRPHHTRITDPALPTTPGLASRERAFDRV
jgi:hypothetical protein